MNPDEFKDVKKGLPPENRAQQEKISYLGLFILVGILLGSVICLVGSIGNFINNSLPSPEPSTITPENREAFIFFGTLFVTIAYSIFLSLIFGLLQALIFREKIKARFETFIAITSGGGFLGGIGGGIALYGLNKILTDFFTHTTDINGLIVPVSFFEGLIVGGFIGAIAGGISSFAQNHVMRNRKYSMRWFLYNLFSWAIIISMGYAISFSIFAITKSMYIGDAIATAVMSIFHGIGLLIFLSVTPQIEFS